MSKGAADARKWFDVSNVSETSADVFIYDFIGSFGVSASAFISQIQALKVGTINVHVNSGGGSVFDGLAIYNGLHAHPARIVVHVDGLAASMASVIAMAGDEIAMAENAFIMIHRVSGDCWGTAEDMRATANLLEKLEQSCVSIYSARTGEKEGEIVKMMTAETWLNSSDALAQGFCDTVTPSKGPSNKLRAVNLANFKNIPAAVSAAIDTSAQVEPMSKTTAPETAPVIAAVDPVAAAPVAIVADPTAALRVEFSAKLSAKDAEIATLQAKLSAAETLSAANIGAAPVLNVSAKAEKEPTILEQYQALSGEARTAFYNKNSAAIWSAYSDPKGA